MDFLFLQAGILKNIMTYNANATQQLISCKLHKSA